MRIVLALGGNSLSEPGTGSDIGEQFAKTRATVVEIADLLDAGHEIIITHGNGPQVGNILRRVEVARPVVYPIPLVLCVADTQAGMGYMIAQCLGNELRKRQREQPVSTVVTTVEVDPNDKGMSNPTKPIGITYTEADAQAHAERDGWRVREIAKGRWRRVVASPEPRKIVEMGAIRALLAAGEVVICCGGGGIPVVLSEHGYDGLDAVIDKDLTSALLAQELAADLLLILTGVERVYDGFGTPDCRAIDAITPTEARRLQASGAFPPGSMGPKVEAAVRFAEAGARRGAASVITGQGCLQSAVAGRSGTRFVATTN